MMVCAQLGRSYPEQEPLQDVLIKNNKKVKNSHFALQDRATQRDKFQKAFTVVEQLNRIIIKFHLSAPKAPHM